MADASAVAGAAKTIASALAKEAKYLYGVEDELRALQSGLECMQQFLHDVDANPNQVKQDGQLRILSFEMRELAFRAEDAIDTYIVDVIHNKNFLSFTSHIHMLRKEIEDIQQKIKDAMSRSENFRASISTIAENYIHLDDEFVVGIGDDITGLVKRLTDRNDDFQVLAIVGPMGAGKTTLASQIYRHTKVQSSFSHRRFVSISQQWSRLDLLHCISKEVLGIYDHLSEWKLVRNLHEFIKDKRFLVVLDNIWKENWDDIYPIFPRTKGLRVILTTRNEEVPQYADNRCVIHMPQMLTDAQMWTLFSKGAVEGRHGIENNVEFEMLGKLLLQKCHGLPLVVVTIAGILRTKQHLYEWRRVYAAFNENILKEKGGSTDRVVEETLELSYLDLPDHLKPLFLYLAIIPKDEVWSSNQLIDMWIAEGFVAGDQIGTSETLEDKGIQFISELAQRYIIQVKKRNHQDEVELLYLHDFMREFCIKKASECRFLEHISSTCSYEIRMTKARRVSISSREHRLEENNFLRTIVYRGFYEFRCGVLRELESIHKDFKLLRVLKISYYANKTLPKQIGNLIHLTYLSVTRTDITELPKSVKKLRNLIYLEFITVFEEAKVPDDLVGSMENLRVLKLPDRLLKSGSSNCNRLGLDSERHRNLHTFKCAAGRWMTKDLPVMHPLTLRDLQISNIKEIEEMEAIYQSLGFFKGSLQTFDCDFIGVSRKLKFDTKKLMGSQSLHTLRLVGRLVSHGTIQFPANLVSLQIIYSEIGEEVDLMGVLGQLSKLKKLYAHGAYLGSQLCCTGTSFPQLEELTLSGLSSLEQWIVEEGAMNRLKKVTIVDCLRLKRLPQGIRSITTLKELHITSMPEEFCWRLGIIKNEDGGPASSVHTQGGEDSYIIEHIPSVKLYDIIHTSNEHDSETESDWETESSSDSDVGESIAAIKETTLKSGVSGGDSLSHQTEHQSPISRDAVTELTSPTPTEIVPVWNEDQHTPHAVPAAEHHDPALRVGFENQGTDDNNNGINKEEAKGMLFLFGEGYEFEKQMLIQLWMALGLLAVDPMEEKGASYFENLVSERYILCSVPNYLYKVNFEKLGTEMNIEKQSCIKLDNPMRNSDSCAETLHASVVCDEINASVFQTLRGFSRLRTLLFLGSYGSRLQQVPRDLFLCYESLEALDLSGTHIKELPSSAGKMINLRYLDLSWTFLEALPERIDRFKKLQTLKLEGCSRLRRLPDEMKGLTGLRHLHLDVLSELSAFPRGMGALVNIRTLSAFPIGTEQGLEISELKYLNHITGSFCIANIENVQSADVAKEAFLNEKKKIKKLNLRWSDHNIECPMNEVESILQNLCPFLNLEEIEIVWYPGNKLPDWIADVSFHKLVSITLFGCAKVNMLPSMENLPALESLELVSLNSLTKMDFNGVAAECVAFPKLKKLSVDEMLNLETWAEAGEGDYPCIEELSIKDCPKLSEFPSIVYSPSLKHLEASGCDSVVLESDKTLPEFLEQLRIEDCPLMEDRCSKDGGQDWHKIQHVPTIWVNHFPIQPIEYMEY